MTERLNESATGVYIISAPPFIDDGSIDFDSADSLVEFYIEKGVSGMTILGMMGEANKMSGDEADGFMRYMLKRVDGRIPVIGKMMMARVGRARERSETQGFMKILVDAETKKVLGAAVLEIGGDEVIHSVLDVMYAEAPYTLIQRAMHIHPTVTELIPTMLGDLKPLE